MIFVYSYLVLLYIRPQDWVSYFQGVPVYDIIIFLMIFSGVNRLQNSATRNILKSPQSYLLIGYLIAILISSVINSEFEMTIIQFKLELKRLLVFFLILCNVDTKEKLYNTLKFSSILMIVLAIHAIIQGETGIGFGGVTLTPGYKVARVRWLGDWDGPNVFAALFIISIPFVIDLIFCQSQVIWKRICGVAMAAMFIYSIYLTNSRGAYIGLAAILASYFYFRYRKKWIWGFGAAISCLVVFLAISPIRTFDMSSTESSAHERVYTWERGLAVFRANPIVGVGKGEFSHRVGTGLIAHNNFVQIFVETGLMGFFFWMGTVWCNLKGLYMRLERQRSTDERRIIEILIAVLIGYIATTFFVVVENELMYVLFGLFTAAVMLEERERQETTWIVNFGKLDIVATATAMFIIIALIWIAAIERVM